MVVFIDNILVYLTDHPDHVSHLRIVMEILWEKKLYSKLKKV
jgi:hypothetical protein